MGTYKARLTQVNLGVFPLGLTALIPDNSEHLPIKEPTIAIHFLSPTQNLFPPKGPREYRVAGR